MEKKKYIIELEEDQYTIRLLKIKNGEKWPQCDFVAVTPYTEPDLEQVREEAYEDGYKTAKVQCNIQAEKDLREVGERHYQKGLSDAWETARKIIHMPEADLLNLFTECYSAVCTSVQVFLKYDASECIEKIRQYEQEKEMDGLRQNIQTIVDECGYSLDEIAEVLQKMKES